MRDNQIASTGKTNQNKLSVSVYVDIQNVPLNKQEANLVSTFANFQGDLNYLKVYYNAECVDQVKIKNHLSDCNFSWINVPCPLKDSADHKLMVDCLKDMYQKSIGNIVIIVSGDGDFEILVDDLKYRGLKVIVLAKEGNVKLRLKELADEFYFIDELPQLLESKTEPNTDGIAYEDAIECLIAAIKIAISKKKKAELGGINNRMLNNQQFPNYTGYASILKSDGKKFSSFGKFVKAVEKDGKVFVKNNEVFLIEEGKMAA